MSGGGLARLRRNLAFGRHIPLKKVARRVELQIKRSLLERFGPARGALTSAVWRRRDPPLRLFPPRTGRLQAGDQTWRFSFLGRSMEMSLGIDWRAPGPGSADQLWRMNLHYMEYLEEVDDGLCAALIDDWMAHNPPYQPGFWRDSWNSYATAVRAVVWMQQLALRARRLPEELVSRAAASLAAQLTFLEHNLETDLSGNHLIKDIKALIWGSRFFSGPDSDRWRTLGLRLLRTAIAEQVLRDGMHYERSPSYHCQVFADLLECRHAFGRDPLGGALDDALARMAQAASNLTHPDGKVALFNDAGLTMAYAPAECLAACERVLGRRAPAQRTFALKDAGYYGLRAGETYFIADCGAIAPDDLVAHGHGDVLSFEWSVAGERIIVDQGVYEYKAGDRRDRSRSALSHNTLTFEGADQADFFGAFRCGRRPRAAVLAYEPAPPGFTLESTHDGFSRLAGAPRHIRRFNVGAREIVIHDRIEGTPNRAALIGFLLHPECRVEAQGGEARIVRGAATVLMSCSRPIEIEDAVWWPDLGIEQATRRLRIRLAPGGRQAVTALAVR